jgi:hypothetical protein
MIVSRFHIMLGVSCSRRRSGLRVPFWMVAMVNGWLYNKEGEREKIAYPGKYESNYS